MPGERATEDAPASRGWELRLPGVRLQGGAAGKQSRAEELNA